MGHDQQQILIVFRLDKDELRFNKPYKGTGCGLG